MSSIATPDQSLLLYYKSINVPFNLHVPTTQGDPQYQWLILDGRKIALSHGQSEIYSYRGIAMAVQDFWNRNHRHIIVCVPNWMKKRYDHFQYCETHYLIELEKHMLVYYLLEKSEGHTSATYNFMIALAKDIKGRIVTQIGSDTRSEPHRKSILQFCFTMDSFMIPVEDLRLPDRIWTYTQQEVETKAARLMDTMLSYIDILKELPPHVNFHGPETYFTKVIIDGSNVAMCHGLYKFFSWPGICLMVKHLWNCGFHNINLFVPNWRINSPSTGFEYELLEIIRQYCYVTPTNSQYYDDRFMLEYALAQNALIVTNDKFRDFEPEWEDVIKRRIPFKFYGNNLLLDISGPMTIRSSSVRPQDIQGRFIDMQGGGYVQQDPPRPDGEDPDNHN